MGREITFTCKSIDTFFSKMYEMGLEYNPKATKRFAYKITFYDYRGKMIGAFDTLAQSMQRLWLW